MPALHIELLQLLLTLALCKLSQQPTRVTLIHSRQTDLDKSGMVYCKQLLSHKIYYFCCL